MFERPSSYTLGATRCSSLVDENTSTTGISNQEQCKRQRRSSATGSSTRLWSDLSSARAVDTWLLLHLPEREAVSLTF
ncbi:Uncharacterized protein HZ326_15092 [Fusarium oxysporum f. sp. albedinis]|nr:Uncharacterized protein HZ326_15092 [Fusarium oxysporum f. sp. albedinis]